MDEFRCCNTPSAVRSPKAGVLLSDPGIVGRRVRAQMGIDRLELQTVPSGSSQNLLGDES